MKYAVIIPARYESSRFPGKPLVDLLGKTMIQHVWERCREAVGEDLVYVATDNDLIRSKVEEFGGQVIMTSENCMTGTDRLAEANKKLDCDFVINVQGDEPLINPDDINKVIKTYNTMPETIINCMCSISNEKEFRSFTVPKVVVSKTGKLLYMSRSPIPMSKTDKFYSAFKQVCIYAFSKQHLEFFSSHEAKTPVEEIEDIEILRFLENDYPVQMIEVEKGSLAIDVKEDVTRVIEVLQQNL
jgi:3-deoxy-manno-octulosonate cytidylyltransferase (CMP-KDO synthetase)